MFSDWESSLPFWCLLVGSFVVFVVILFLFVGADEGWNQWRLPFQLSWGFPKRLSDEECQLKDDPLKFLKSTRPWCDAALIELNSSALCDVSCRFSTYPRAEEFWVDGNVKLLHWKKTKGKVEKCGDVCNCLCFAAVMVLTGFWMKLKAASTNNQASMQRSTYLSHCITWTKR
jgi:hypothetical protein